MARSDNKQPKSQGSSRNGRGADKSLPPVDELVSGVDLDAIVPLSTPAPGDAQPNPVELPAPINPEGGRKHSVEMHRNLFCAYYDGCLDEAVKRGWNSFTCRECEYYHDQPEEGAGVERFATQRRAF